MNLENLTDSELIEYEKLLSEEFKDQAREDLLKFTQYTFPQFQSTWFHENYYQVLNEFAYKRIKKLIITVPPQHGKSEGSTRRLPAFMFGLNPDEKIAIASYSDTFAKKFNRDVQRIVDDKDYYDLFPDTMLNASNVVNVSDNALRNASEFEIIGARGGLKAVGRGGPLTGNSVDVMIMDDLYKDYMEGNSPVIRESVWDWYTSVVKTRLHNDSQQLIVFTRWHQDDLIGKIEKKEQVITIDSFEQLKDVPPDSWVKINYEAIKTGPPTALDPREKGEALYPEKHNKGKLAGDRAADPEKFNCLYQGDPRSKEGLLYSDFKTYITYPDAGIRKNYTDTADSGDDFLCSIDYIEDQQGYCYVIDIIYTQDSMETTEESVSTMMNINRISLSNIESNAGGRSFARTIEKLTGATTEVKWFHQSKNKESRIFSNSATVNKLILFPEGWHYKWPEFYDHVTNYKKLFKANDYDDAPDVLTGMVEKSGKDNAPLIMW